jgi:uncharacterized protein DUF6496
MAQYGKRVSEKVEKAMHERKKGTLKGGRSGVNRLVSKTCSHAVGHDGVARSVARSKEWV